MIIGYFSDIHFHHWGRHKVSPKVIINLLLQNCEDCDVIINAGDTEYDLESVFKKNFPNKIYFEVKGNHDFYKKSVDDLINDEPKEIVVGGIKIAGGTLWTDLWNNPINDVLFYQFTDSKWINDFSPAIQIYKHQKDKDIICRSNADIIVTHHPPFTKSIAEEYKRDPFTPFFVNRLENFVDTWEKKPKIWVCGHVHHKHEYNENGIEVKCNPYGYPFEPNWENFKVEKFEL